MEYLMKPTHLRRLQIALILSLFLHSAITVVFFFKVSRNEVSQTHIEVELLPPPVAATPTPNEEKQKQLIVDQDEKALNDEKPVDSRFLSAHNQVVKKQTVAAHHGEFKNAGKEKNVDGKDGAPRKVDLQKLLPKMDAAKSIKERQEREMLYEKTSEVDAIKRQKDQQRNPAAFTSGRQPEKTGASGSATLDYIKELDPSTETLLSTREFVYYTYYSRIRKQLNQYWGPNVREKVSQIYKQGRSIASDEDRITRCLVTLDRRGNLLKVQIIGHSGIYELDQAAVDAFRAAAPFPNPPEGIVESDGKIKIRWDFILEA